MLHVLIASVGLHVAQLEIIIAACSYYIATLHFQLKHPHRLGVQLDVWNLTCYIARNVYSIWACVCEFLLRLMWCQTVWLYTLVFTLWFIQ